MKPASKKPRLALVMTARGDGATRTSSNQQQCHTKPDGPGSTSTQAADTHADADAHVDEVGRARENEDAEGVLGLLAGYSGSDSEGG